MAGFSGHTDYFGLASATLALHSSSETPHPKGQENATDERDNIVDQGEYVGGPGTPVECVYRLISGSLDLSTLSLGALVVASLDDCIVESITVTTSGGEWPEITVSGIQWTGATTCVSEFALPAITVNGCKLAQEIGFALSGETDYRLTGSSLTASAEISHVLSDKDTVGAVALSGGSLEISGDFVAIDGVPTVTYSATNVVAIQTPTMADEITGYGTGSFSGAGFIEAETTTTSA
jgi:hypothetical protein